MFNHPPVPVTRSGRPDRRYGQHPHPARAMGQEGEWEVVLAFVHNGGIYSYSGRLLGQALLLRDKHSRRVVVCGAGEAEAYFHVPAASVRAVLRQAISVGA